MWAPLYIRWSRRPLKRCHLNQVLKDGRHMESQAVILQAEDGASVKVLVQGRIWKVPRKELMSKC